MLVQALQQDGYDVYGIYNNFDFGQEIMEQINTGTYGLFLTDINRPKPNGLELTWRIRNEGFGLPIIIMTGDGTPENILMARDYGADFLILKPFKLMTLRSCIYKIFERRNLNQITTVH